MRCERRSAPALHADLAQSARALAHREKVAEHFEVAARTPRDRAARRRASARDRPARVERRLDDAEILRLPVGADQERARRGDRSGTRGRPRAARTLRKSSVRIVRARVAPLGRGRAFRADEQIALGLAAHRRRDRSSRPALRRRARSAAVVVPSTCARTRRPSSVTGSFSTYSSVRLSSAQATPRFDVLDARPASSSPVARSLMRSRYWRRPTVSTA